MLNHLPIPVYVQLHIYTFAYEVSVYNTTFCPVFWYIFHHTDKQ